MEFSLYVHIPFCAVRCPYCDFNVTVARNRPEERYLEAITAELRSRWKSGPWRAGEVRSVFFGGGTPSLIAPGFIAEFMGEVRRCARERFLPREVTLEANPEALRLASLEGWRRAGIDRLSLGAQSFQARHLAFLGRLHSADEIDDAVRLARAAGFGNVSLDLIFGMPGQTLEELDGDLARVIALAPEHVSAYNLTMEPRTRLYREWKRGKFQLPGEDEQAEMFGLIGARLSKAGLRRYEISNFAREGFESVHNRHYWMRGSSLGIGAGAHSCIASSSGGRRWWNLRDHKRFMSRAIAGESCVEGEEALSPRDARREWVFLRLRLVEGFSVDEFEETFGAGFHESFPGVLDRLVAAGLVPEGPGRVALSERGRLFSDDAFLSFF